jgi:hypothetical protein
MLVEDTGVVLEDGVHNDTVHEEGETYAEKLQKAVGARNWTVPLRFATFASGVGVYEPLRL